MIQAIETEYAGYKFRSRLEARWAVFFNAMGVKWYYEHEGYKLSSGWYLPDFWLPEWRLHVEIKPDGVCQHAHAFRDEVGALIVTCGLPGEKLLTYCWDTCDSGGGTYDCDDAVFADNNGLCLCIKDRSDRAFFVNSRWDIADKIHNCDKPRPSLRLRDAFNLAKQARFDKRR